MLFPDTKAIEDAIQQVIGADLAGDFAEGFLSLAKIFGHEFAGGGRCQDRAGSLQVAQGFLQGIQVPAAGEEFAFASAVKTGNPPEMLLQQIDARTAGG